jgi:hypothetical protein
LLGSGGGKRAGVLCQSELRVDGNFGLGLVAMPTPDQAAAAFNLSWTPQKHVHELSGYRCETLRGDHEPSSLYASFANVADVFDATSTAGRVDHLNHFCLK